MIPSNIKSHENCRGLASLFMIFALFILLSLQTELAYQYMNRSESIRVFRQRFREEEQLHLATIDNYGFTEKDSTKLFIGSSYLYFKPLNNDYAFPTPLFARREHSPSILWRKFLHGELSTSLCEKHDSLCNIVYRGVVRTYSSVRVNNLQLISSNNTNYKDNTSDYKYQGAIGTPEVFLVNGLLSIKRGNEDNSPSLFIIAAYHNISISELEIPGSNAIILFYSARGEINLPAFLPDHANCVDNKIANSEAPKRHRSEDLPILLLFGSKAFSGERSLNLSHYQNCIKVKVEAWFPGEKLVGFTKR